MACSDLRMLTRYGSGTFFRGINDLTLSPDNTALTSVHNWSIVSHTNPATAVTNTIFSRNGGYITSAVRRTSDNLVFYNYNGGMEEYNPSTFTHTNRIAAGYGGTATEGIGAIAINAAGTKLYCIINANAGVVRIARIDMTTWTADYDVDMLVPVSARGYDIAIDETAGYGYATWINRSPTAVSSYISGVWRFTLSTGVVTVGSQLTSGSSGGFWSWYRHVAVHPAGGCKATTIVFRTTIFMIGGGSRVVWDPYAPLNDFPYDILRPSGWVAHNITDDPITAYDGGLTTTSSGAANTMDVIGPGPLVFYGGNEYGADVIVANNGNAAASAGFYCMDGEYTGGRLFTASTSEGNDNIGFIGA